MKLFCFTCKYARFTPSEEAYFCLRLRKEKQSLVDGKMYMHGPVLLCEEERSHVNCDDPPGYSGYCGPCGDKGYYHEEK